MLTAYFRQNDTNSRKVAANYGRRAIYNKEVDAFLQILSVISKINPQQTMPAVCFAVILSSMGNRKLLLAADSLHP